MSGNLLYLFITIGVILLGILGAYAMRKFNIKSSDLDNSDFVLEFTQFMNSQFEYENKDKVDLVIKYTRLGLKIVNEYYKADDMETKKSLVKSETIKLCKNNGVEFNQETVEMIDKAIDFCVKNFVK